MNFSSPPSFHVITGDVVANILSNEGKNIINLIAKTYQDHEAGHTVNPDSYFLRFPSEPNNRIIALPASLQTESAVSGIKWIASYPENTKSNLQRASSIQILNSYETGYPYAVLESSKISAVRTAASAVLGANLIFANTDRLRTCKAVSFIGCGVISRSIIDQFMVNDWEFSQIITYDIDKESRNSLSNYVNETHGMNAHATESLEQAIATDIVVFATNSGKPYILEKNTFKPGQTILNISLRDLGPEIILSSQNLFDDIEHCLKANTSPHLAEQMVNNRDFVSGTIASLERSEVKLKLDSPIIYSPFGMGVLDLALSNFIYKKALELKKTIEIPNFFGQTNRW